MEAVVAGQPVQVPAAVAAVPSSRERVVAVEEPQVPVLEAAKALQTKGR
jgi:hypothetical protein